MGTWLVRVFVVLVAAELAYVVVANVLLRTRLPEQWANPRPEKTRVSWSGAWSIVPGLVHASRVSLRGRSPRQEWFGTLDSVRARIDLSALSRRRLVFANARIGDVAFEIAPRPAPAETSGSEGREKARRDPSGWELELRDVVARGTHSCAFPDLVVEAEGRIGVRLVNRIREWLEAPYLSLEADTVGVWRGGEALVEGLSLELEGRLRRFDPREYRGRKVFEAFEGEVHVAGELQRTGALGRRMRAGVELEGGGPVEARIVAAGGRMQPGTSLAIESGGFETALLGFAAEGAGSASYRVTHEGEHAIGRWDVLLDDVEVRRIGATTADARGRGLRLETREVDPPLLALSDEVTTMLRLDDAEIPDLRVLDALLPERLGVSIVGGSASVDSGFVLDPDNEVSGQLSLTAEGLAADAIEHQIVGDLSVDVILEHGDLDARRFDFGGSKVSFRNARAREAVPTEESARPWWIETRFEAGTIRFGSPVEIDSDVSLRLSDVRPIVVLVAERSERPEWFSVVPSIRDVEGSAGVRVDAEGVFVSDGVARSGRLEVRSRLRFVDRVATGQVYVHYGVVGVGVDLQPGRRDWKLVGARRWYDAAKSAP